jgi:uncharacterized protein (DUF779 family)
MGLRVAAVDVSDDKLDLARRFGAEVLVNAAKEDPVARIQEATGGTDGVLVTAVHPRAFGQAIGMARRGGTITFNGLPPGDFPAPIFDTVLKGLTIRGSIVGTRQDMVEALDFYSRGKIRPTVHTRRLDEINAVFDELRGHRRRPGRAGLPVSAVTAPSRIVVTASAADLLRRLAAVHGALMMHQSGGCCDGSAPMCYPTGEFIVGDRDVLVGMLDLRLEVGQVPADLPGGVDAVPVWISGPQFEVWKHTQLVLDVVPGRGSGFSLEAPEGMRFLSRARAFAQAEIDALADEDLVIGEGWASGSRPAPPTEPQVVAEAADACPVPARGGNAPAIDS